MGPENDILLREIKIEASPLTNKRERPLSKFEKEALKHDMDVQDELRNNTWDSLCMRMDRRAVTFFSQFIIIIGVMVFCAIKLSGEDTSQHSTYLALLTTMIGVIIPSPKFSK